MKYQWPPRPRINETEGVHILMNKVNFGIYASKKQLIFDVFIWEVCFKCVVDYMDENWPCSHLLNNVNVSITVNKESTVNNFSPIKSWLFERKKLLLNCLIVQQMFVAIIILCLKRKRKKFAFVPFNVFWLIGIIMIITF